MDKMIQHAEKYESFEDLPWGCLDHYKRLDEHFPNSKFILTVRHPNKWFMSMKSCPYGIINSKMEDTILGRRCQGGELDEK